MKNTNDPNFPGEKEVNTSDVLLIVAGIFAIVPTIVGIYSLIWSDWDTLRVCATTAFTALLFIIGIVLVEPMFKKGK
jgi:uncharacterized membrane protein YqjE